MSLSYSPAVPPSVPTLNPALTPSLRRLCPYRGIRHEAMAVDFDTLGIPDTEYDARVTLPAPEFARIIVKDLSELGDSVPFEVSKEGVRFANDGEGANRSVLMKQTDAAREKYVHLNDEDETPGTRDEDDTGEDREGTKKKTKKDNA